MKKLAIFSVVMLLFAVGANAQCGSNCLFYGGDFDPNNPNANDLANELNNGVSAATYENFIIPAGQTWMVTGLFTNNATQYTPTGGYWEIRSGVSEGNGGTLLASGTGAITHTPTGRSAFGLIEYMDEVAVNPQPLPPGEYWFSVVPVCETCIGQSFNTNTFGLNAVGTQISNEQFFNSPTFGANFTNANNEGVFPTFSSGVAGTEVPEPSSIIMLSTSLVAAVSAVRRRLL